MKLNVLIAGAIAFGLTACGGAMKVSTPMTNYLADTPAYAVDEVVNAGTEAPASFLLIIKEEVEKNLVSRGMLAPKDAPAARRIKIVLSKYRMRSDAARFMLGVLAGKDGIESTVSVIDAVTGEVLGETNVSAFNAMAVGSPSTIAHYHAQQVELFLLGKNNSSSATEGTETGGVAPAK